MALVKEQLLSVDSSLAYMFYGGDVSFPLPSHKDNLLHGYYSGQVGRKFWDILNAKLRKIQYQQLDTSYQHSVDDQSLEVIIDYNGKTKHIRAQSASLPDSVREVFYWIANSYKQVKLSPVKYTLQFETSIH